MRAAGFACVSLDRRRCVDNLQLVAVSSTVTFSRGTTRHREGRPVGLPAFGGSAGVVVGDIALDADLTGRSLHLQTSVPPVKLPEPCLTPLSMDGWI